MLTCRCLGSAEVEANGQRLDVRGPVPRRVLAGLMLADGDPLSDEGLADLAWGQRRPADVPQALRVAVHRIRQALGEHGSLVQRTERGYRLAVAKQQFDHNQFADLVDAGLAELGRGDAAAAVRSLDGVLALWRGLPWSDLGESISVAAARNRLVELRDIAIDELQAARLAHGDVARAVAALSEGVAAAPYRERRWELLALALYRSGRQAHALSELRRVRRLMIEELGVEPGPALRALEQRILTGDASLMATTTSDDELSSPQPAPRPVHVFAGPATTFVGRDEEVSDLDRLLESARLVTVTGPAGVGKTRLVLEYAARRSDAWLVRLADIRSAEALAPVIATAIGLSYVAGDPKLAIARALADTAGLLIIDNCEHLDEAVAAMTADLLAGCPRLQVLATSRTILNVEAEVCKPLAPLPIGREGADGPAVTLLLERIRNSQPDWHDTTGQRVPAREICRALDGLPLAIELAAARVRAFGLAEIAVHLRQRLDILGETPAGSVSAHRSLQAAIGWSIDQLDAPDRAVLLGLWPFEGGFTWQAAAAVQPGTDSGPILATLAALVDRSLVTVDVSLGAPRYRMLHTMRRFCESIDPDPTATQAAHAAWARAFAVTQAQSLWGHGRQKRSGYCTVSSPISAPASSTICEATRCWRCVRRAAWPRCGSASAWFAMGSGSSAMH